MHKEFVAAHPNNYTPGRRFNGKDYPVTHIIIHSIVGSAQSAINTFRRSDRKASAHYVVSKDGVITQMVHENNTAWHCGNWNMNLSSIGIEHDDSGKPHDVRPDSLYEAAAQLVADICKRYGIPVDRSRIRKHSEVSDKPTACPAGLDIDRIVARAREILDTSPTPKSVTGNTDKIVELIADTNIRTSPRTDIRNIVTVLKKGQKVRVDPNVLPGESVGGIEFWWKVDGKEEYIWSGATRAVATLPVDAPIGSPLETPQIVAIGAVLTPYRNAPVYPRPGMNDGAYGVIGPNNPGKVKEIRLVDGAEWIDITQQAWGGGTGWVKVTDLVLTKPQPKPTEVPVTPKPVDVKPTPVEPKAPDAPAVDGVDTTTLLSENEELRAALEALRKKHAGYLEKEAFYEPQITERDKKIKQLTTENEQLRQDMKNFTVLRDANQVLSDTIDGVYKPQIETLKKEIRTKNDALSNVFGGWELHQVEKGGTSLPRRVRLALRMMTLGNEQYVIGWKKGGRIVRTDEPLKEGETT